MNYLKEKTSHRTESDTRIVSDIPFDVTRFELFKTKILNSELVKSNSLKSRLSITNSIDSICDINIKYFGKAGASLISIVELNTVLNVDTYVHLSENDENINILFDCINSDFISYTIITEDIAELIVMCADIDKLNLISTDGFDVTTKIIKEVL